MPNRTIYIRNKDLEIWDAVEHKAELVAWALEQWRIRQKGKEQKNV